MSENLILVKSSLLHLFRFNLANVDLQLICDDLDKFGITIAEPSNEFSQFCDVLKLKFGIITWENFQNYWKFFPKWIEFGKSLANDGLDGKARKTSNAEKANGDRSSESYPESQRASYSDCDIGSKTEEQKSFDKQSQVEVLRSELKAELDVDSADESGSGSESPVVEYPDISKIGRKSTIHIKVTPLSVPPKPPLPSVAPKPSVRRVLNFDKNWKQVPESPTSPLSQSESPEPRPASRPSLTSSIAKPEVIATQSSVENPPFNKRDEALSVNSIPRDSAYQSDENHYRVSNSCNNATSRQSDSYPFDRREDFETDRFSVSDGAAIDQRSNTLRVENPSGSANERSKKQKLKGRKFFMKTLSESKKKLANSVENLF